MHRCARICATSPRLGQAWTIAARRLLILSTLFAEPALGQSSQGTVAVTIYNDNLALVQAKRVLTELEKDIESHRASGQAAIFLAQEKHNKAVARLNSAKMQVKRDQ